MLRLGHVAFLGTGLLNLAFALSVDHVGLEQAPGVSGACRGFGPRSPILPEADERADRWWHGTEGSTAGLLWRKCWFRRDHGLRPGAS